MRQTLFLAASVAALMALPAHAQTTPTEDTAAGAAVGNTATATGNAAGAVADATGDALGDAADATGDAATATADAVGDAVSDTQATSAETVTTSTDAGAAAAEASGDPMMALTQAAQRLDQAANRMLGGGDLAMDGTVPSDNMTGTGTGVTADSAAAVTEPGEMNENLQMAVQEAGTALDDFDGALQQVSASGDQAIQDRVTALQAQSQQVRQQFQNDPQQAAYGMEALAQAAMGLQTASLPAEADAIVGRTVVTLDGEEAGEVANLLVTPDGRVSGLVLRRSGALGLGGTQFAVTWDQISIEGVQYVVNMTRDQLENLPEYRTE